MDETTKYLIHARIAASGVVERSDVVGAVFGQTEGLLGDELDLRDLQQSSKVGRIDVQIRSENGQSFGTLTIATSLDKAETAILGASLETIERVGPCRADIEVSEIEDVRAAKRREVVDRAKELLATAFDESVISTDELVADVRESVRVEDIVEYEELPAGPRVDSSDAIIVVEGRADVLQLLKYGIKNVIAVEGTDVPDTVARLSTERTTTVFVDGDRGGELILRELLQVGDVDFVAFAPPGQSVEDLSRSEVLDRLRQKVAANRLDGDTNVRETVANIIDGDGSPAATPEEQSGDTAGASTPPPEAGVDHDTSPAAVEVVPTSSAELGSATREPKNELDHDGSPTQDAGGDTVDSDQPRPGSDEADGGGSTDGDDGSADGDDGSADGDDGSTDGDDGSTDGDDGSTDGDDGSTDGDDGSADGDDGSTDGDGGSADSNGSAPDSDDDADDRPTTLRSHVHEIIDGNRERARLLGAEFETLNEAECDELVDAIDAADGVFSVVVDGLLTQRMLDAAAQHGIDHIVARETGEFVKKPVGTRVLTAEQLRPPEPEIEV